MHARFILGSSGGETRRKRPKYSRRKKGMPTQALLAHPQASGLMPLDYMLAIMRDESQPMKRGMEMAIACAPYFHPKLRRVEVTGARGWLAPELPAEVRPSGLDRFLDSAT